MSSASSEAGTGLASSWRAASYAEPCRRPMPGPISPAPCAPVRAPQVQQTNKTPSISTLIGTSIHLVIGTSRQPTEPWIAGQPPSADRSRPGSIKSEKASGSVSASIARSTAVQGRGRSRARRPGRACVHDALIVVPSIGPPPPRRRHSRRRRPVRPCVRDVAARSRRAPTRRSRETYACRCAARTGTRTPGRAAQKRWNGQSSRAYVRLADEY